MRFVVALAAAAALLAGCMTAAPLSDSLDAIARDYVRMTLEIGERDDGYVDAYYGPPEIREAARAAPRTMPELAAAAGALQTRLAAIPRARDPLVGRRHIFLDAQLTAARTRLRMLQGERLSFADEARGLYGAVPDIRPLADYDPILARIEALVPGTGPLADRVDAFQERFAIPTARQDAVMRAAIAECRRRTVAHIPMPEGESFVLEFVTGRSWSGYNWYQGNYRSLIQVNTDQSVAARPRRRPRLPRRLSRPPRLQRPARAEAGARPRLGRVPGLSALFAAVVHRRRQRQLRRRSRFPGRRAARLSRPASSTRSPACRPDCGRLYRAPEGDGRSVRRPLHHRERLLEGRIDREQAVVLTQRYQLVSRRRAEQSVAFTDQYRTYVINYGLGEKRVAAYVEGAGTDPAARWAAMGRLLSEPTLPVNLLPRTE